MELDSLHALAGIVRFVAPTCHKYASSSSSTGSAEFWDTDQLVVLEKSRRRWSDQVRPSGAARRGFVTVGRQARSPR